VLALGYIVRGPIGGMCWSDLHYLLGVVDLGHDVYFIEDSDDYPSCYDPIRNTTDVDPTYGLQFARRVFERVGLDDRWGYYDAHTSRWLGGSADRMLDVCAGADLLLNLGGVNPLRPWLLPIPARALIDKDPVFTQVRHLTDPVARERARQHTAFFSFGENIAGLRSAVPPDGFPWQATRHPIFLDAWPVTPAPEGAKFTTVMQWDSYAVRAYQGAQYGMKSQSFTPYLDLPEKAGRVFELAVAGSATLRALLDGHGWAVLDPIERAWDPWAYQRYIQQSRAEWSVAKHGYVISQSGWFSERSAAYLASGRPVLLQETGFSDWLPTGAGVVPFRSPAEALAGIEAINGRYDFHCQAARTLAEKYFDSRTVLRDLIERAVRTGCASPRRDGDAGADEGTSSSTSRSVSTIHERHASGR
jgi:hypothetical protein